MSNKLLLKKSSVASKKPIGTDLDYGELALNYTDGKLYYKTNTNSIASFTSDTNGSFVTLPTGTTAMAFDVNRVVKVTPNATATFTTTIPYAGAYGTIILLTSGTTSYTISFGSGFLASGDLITGTETGKYFTMLFVSDGTSMIEINRTAVGSGYLLL